VGKCARMKVRREAEPHKKVDNDLCSPLVIVHVQYPPAIFYNAGILYLASNSHTIALQYS
jgi:hypothetical protein